MNQINLKKELSTAQKYILDIFSYVYRYLSDEHIEYYMLGGTLLGAVRHYGFIPWDDDIDIGIPRSQYEYLLENIQEKLPEHLKLETYTNTPSHHYYFARIVDTRYSFRREGSLVVRNENVWVDIFPLDGMPNNFFLRRIHMLKILINRAKYHISCFDKVNLKRPNRPLSERIVIAFVEKTGWGRNTDTKEMLVKLDRLMKKYPVEKSNYIANIMGQYKFKEMFLKSVYGNGKLYPFEEYQLMGPEDYNKVLTQMYGDYMKPPDNKNAHAMRLNQDNMTGGGRHRLILCTAYNTAFERRAA